MALVMSSPILCSSKSLDGPSGELPESPFTFSQALQKVKAVFPNGSPVPTKYEAVAPPFRVLKALRARGADRGLAFRRASAERAGVRSHDRRPAETCRAQTGDARALERKTPATFPRSSFEALPDDAPRVLPTPAPRLSLSSAAPSAARKRCVHPRSRLAATAHHDGAANRPIAPGLPPRRKRPPGVPP